MNGSVHHRHTLNLSTVSNSSSKPNQVANESKVSVAAGGANVLDSTLNATNNVTTATTESTENKSVCQSKINYAGNHHVGEKLKLLGMLSVASVLVAFLAIVFFLKITPYIDLQIMENTQRLLSVDECKIVHDVIVGLLMCTVSLDFTCFLVCASQCLFAAKLLKVAQGVYRASRYLHCGSCSRGIAVCGFFISVPVFLTALILYSFIHFRNVSAIVVTSLLGGGIFFSGVTIIYNAHLWQRELARPLQFVKADAQLDGSLSTNQESTTQVPQMELSTLV